MGYMHVRANARSNTWLQSLLMRLSMRTATSDPATKAFAAPGAFQSVLSGRWTTQPSVLPSKQT